MKSQDKPEQKIKVAEGSEGQNPYWPGDAMHNAGEVLEGDNGETTVIPLVDTVGGIGL